MNKSLLRSNIRELREKLSQMEVENDSNKIIEVFLESEYYKNSKVIMSYMPIKNEVDVKILNQKILSDGKKLILPIISDIDELIPVEVSSMNELRKKGKYSIMEPRLSQEYLGELDLIIVPGVVFDSLGNRIGFGKGYYDKFLKSKLAARVSLIYNFQIIDQIIPDEHDEKIDVIITKGGCYIGKKE